ncbi:hypothetical protein ACIBH1_45265 [Nonomuraea sp. NPDC050663]|uniref:hypothetical protein n=1 Tax=Nonomuraea sp. NPDC050663 TaxID=3364370 RepID=UPI0037921A07
MLSHGMRGEAIPPHPTPVTAAQAAERLERTPATIRQWAIRYGARQLGRAGRETVYDYADLASIEACIWRGEPVPPTPADRDDLRAQLVWEAAA